MSFTLSKPLKLLSIGGSLITTASLWFFNPKSPARIQTRSPEVSSPKNSNPNLNILEAVPKLSSLTGTITSDNEIKEQSFPSGQQVYKFKLKTNDSEKLLQFPQNTLDNLELGNVLGYKNDYESFDKTSIQIKLFSKYAWHTSDGQEEFQNPLSTEQINDLFNGVDEIKTKQLLLSLQKSRIWKVNGTVNTSGPTYYYADIRQPQHTNNLDGLKDLKIKYFSDFDSLKDYVHKKVKGSCKDDSKACVAHKDELNILDLDQYKFFHQREGQ